MSRTRPWRAAAYWPLPGGRLYAGRVAGATWPGIRRWVARQRAAGLVVVVWEVLPIPGSRTWHPEL